MVSHDYLASSYIWASLYIPLSSQNSLYIARISSAGISNAMTTSTGVLPSENNLKACDSFDFDLILSILVEPKDTMKSLRSYM
jgi:hypothetical protein